MKKVILAIVISNILLASCSRTFPCYKQSITPVFIGFDLSDLDTLIIREYKKDGNFLTLLDTTLIVTDSRILQYSTSNDTTIVELNRISDGPMYIYPNYDWQVYVPSTNTTISIAGFISPQTEQKCVLGGDLCPACVNPIYSFTQNGIQITPEYGPVPFGGGSHYLTYVHR